MIEKERHCCLTPRLLKRMKSHRYFYVGKCPTKFWSLNCSWDLSIFDLPVFQKPLSCCLCSSLVVSKACFNNAKINWHCEPRSHEFAETCGHLCVSADKWQSSTTALQFFSLGWLSSQRQRLWTEAFVWGGKDWPKISDQVTCRET